MATLVEGHEVISKLVDARVNKHIELISRALETDYLPLRLAACKFHIAESYLYKLKYQGKIKFYKLGKLSYVKSSELEGLFQEAA